MTSKTVTYICEIISFKAYGTYIERIVLDQTNGYLYFTATSDSSSNGYIGVINPSSLNSKRLITSLNLAYGLAIYSSKG